MTISPDPLDIYSEHQQDYERHEAEKDMLLDVWTEHRDITADLVETERMLDAIESGEALDLSLNDPDIRKKCLNAFPMTDTGNAEALTYLYGRKLRYDTKSNRWLVWNGDYWIVSEKGEYRQHAIDLVRERQEAALLISDDTKRKKAFSWLHSSESYAHINAICSTAMYLAPLPITTPECDCKPWLLACANGVVDLKDGTLHPGRQRDLITQTTGIVYDPSAPCSRWLQFLDEVFLSDKPFIEFIQRAVGYSLAGLTNEQCFFLCYGGGSNGKSKFLNTIRKVAGTYGKHTQSETLMELRSKNKDLGDDIAVLQGSRLVTAIEIGEGRALNEARVKSLTGGDPISCRFLFGQYFVYHPTFTIWLAVNHKPVIRGVDEAIWRRVRLIPFNAYFPPDAPDTDHDIEEKLNSELPGILAWAVRGCLKWQERGLKQPEAVAAATGSYRTEMDTFGQFLDQCVHSAIGNKLPAASLYARYRSWCETNKEFVLSNTAFGKRMTEHAYQRIKVGTYFYLDIALNEPKQSPDDSLYLDSG